ncbi:hypothetical protein GC173_17005 [bacterium]|nr:hypothetical protein [bacterium]
MVIPDRDVLRSVVKALLDERFDADNPAPYAGKILGLVRGADPDAVGVAVQYVLSASVESIQEFHGEPPPDRGALAVMRFHLAEIRNRTESADLPLPSSQIHDLARVFSERDAFSSEANRRPSMDTTAARRMSSDQRQTTSTRRGTSASTTEFPMAPAASTKWKEQPPEEVMGVDVLGRPVRKSEWRHYIFAAITLGIAVALTLEIGELTWPMWVKAVVSAGVPIAVLGTVAFSKSLRFLRYLRNLLIWGSIGTLVVTGVTYTAKIYRHYTAIQRRERVERDFDAILQAVKLYHRKEGIYPRSLDALFSPVDYFEGTSIRGTGSLVDPFARRGAQYEYTRSLDAYLVESVGPNRTAATIELPSRVTREFGQELDAVSYDPTNGVFSDGRIYLLGRGMGD